MEIYAYNYAYQELSHELLVGSYLHNSVSHIVTLMGYKVKNFTFFKLIMHLNETFDLSYNNFVKKYIPLHQGQNKNS